jgi:uncharacterized membrane protein
MATLFAIVYPDRPTAERALETALGLETAGYLTILERALVTRNEQGKVDVSAQMHPVRNAAVTGGVIGAVAGLIFFAPVAGAAVGASIGAILGKGSTSGGSGDFSSFSNDIKNELPNGGAALVLLARTDARDRVLQSMGQHGGTIRSHDISEEDLAAIQREASKYA